MLQNGKKAETLKSAGATKVSTKVLEVVAHVVTDVPCATCYMLQSGLHSYIVAWLQRGGRGKSCNSEKLKSEIGRGRQRFRQRSRRRHASRLFHRGGGNAEIVSRKS
jgi:hypothetical protein